MGTGTLSKLRKSPSKMEPEVEAKDVVAEEQGGSLVPARRHSFYSSAQAVDEKKIETIAQENPGMSWFGFLVHSELCTMNYDCLACVDEQRLQHVTRMMENLKVTETLGLEAAVAGRLAADVQALMRENPYHNFCHATDVTQYVYTLLVSTHVAEAIKPVELAGAFLGALCHDLDHPGLSNTYQNNENTEVAVRYEKQSPLENHHLSNFNALCEKHGLLAKCAAPDAARVREVVEHMILATDMAKHGALMKEIAEKLEDDTFNPIGSKEGVNLLLMIALKCADISNQARPWKVANRWNEAVYKEFYHEGDLDRAAGRPVAPLNDRDANVIPKSTVGFIGFVVVPLYEKYTAIMKRCARENEVVDARAVEECLKFLQLNKQRYQRLADGEAVDPDEEEAELKNFPKELTTRVISGASFIQKKNVPLYPSSDFLLGDVPLDIQQQQKSPSANPTTDAASDRKQN